MSKVTRVTRLPLSTWVTRMIRMTWVTRVTWVIKMIG